MTEHRDYYVYVYFRLNGQPLYVGKGRGRRLHAHKAPSRGNSHLHNAIRQAMAKGRELPVVVVATNLTDEQARSHEVAWIAALGREIDGGPLINQTSGGEGMAGHRQSAETRAQRSRALIGRPKTPEHAAAAAAARRGWRPTPQHTAACVAANRGRPVPQERRDKIAATMTAPERIERTLAGAAKAREALAAKRALKRNSVFTL